MGPGTPLGPGTCSPVLFSTRRPPHCAPDCAPCPHPTCSLLHSILPLGRRERRRGAEKRRVREGRCQRQGQERCCLAAFCLRFYKNNYDVDDYLGGRGRDTGSLPPSPSGPSATTQAPRKGQEEAKRQQAGAPWLTLHFRPIPPSGKKRTTPTPTFRTYLSGHPCSQGAGSG